MWNVFSCYLSGRHDFGKWCEPGAIFLRCVHCGKRSSGWSMDAQPRTHVSHVSAPVAKPASVSRSHVLPFGRAAS